MRSYRSLLAGLLALLLPLAATAGAPGPSLADREAEVWAALIDNGIDTDTRSVVLAETTTGDAAGLTKDPAVSSAVVKQLALPAGLFPDWARRNAAIGSIDLPLKLRVTYQVVNAKTRKEIFEGVEPAAGWARFFERYKGAPGLLRLSHVGFDESFAHALVYTEQICGAECGAGRIFHLTRNDKGGWTVADEATVWMVK